MPRPRAPARLHQRKDDGAWVIVDGGKQQRTGYGRGQHAEAQRALADYLAEQRPARSGPAAPSEVTVGEILSDYLDGRGPAVADPGRLCDAVAALSPFWSDLTVERVTRKVCRDYVKWRTTTARTIVDKAGRTRIWPPAAASTARRELGALQAALNWAHADQVLAHPIKVTFPEKPTPRSRWLSRSEAAALLRAASPHLRRFILIALYTGRRRDSILRLRWAEALDAGWVDLEKGIIQFRGAQERQTKKRRGSVRAPRQLHAHLRRWRAVDGDAATHVIEWNGMPIASVKRAWREARERAGLGPEVTPHTLKHTAVTWAFQRGISLEDAADYFDTTAATLEAVYRQHSPDHQQRAVAIMEKRAG